MIIDPQESYLLKVCGDSWYSYRRITFEGAGMLVEEELYTVYHSGAVDKEDELPVVYHPECWVESFSRRYPPDVIISPDDLDEVFLGLL